MSRAMFMWHRDVKTIGIYTHVLKRGARGVRSPLSGLNKT